MRQCTYSVLFGMRNRTYGIFHQISSRQLGGARNLKSDRFGIFGAPLPTHSPIGGHVTCDSKLHYVFAYQLLPLLVQRVVFEGRKT